MMYWYPRIKDLAIPQPKTKIYKLSKQELKIFHNEQFPPTLMKNIESIISEFSYPLFVRTDFASGKHGWKDTCFIENKEKLSRNIFEIIVDNLIADLFGLPFEALVFREYIPLEARFEAFYGNMPVAKERRYFINNDQIQCFTPETEIIMSNLERKPISSIVVNDSILCDANKNGKVIRTYKRDYEGILLKIRYTGNTDQSLCVTPNHKLFVIKRSSVICKKGFHSNYRNLTCTIRIKNKNSLSFCNTPCDGMEWKIQKVEASSLEKDDYLLIPINNFYQNLVLDIEKIIGKQKRSKFDHNSQFIPVKIPIDKSFMRWAGYFLAEGSTYRNRISFGFHEDEQDYVNEVCLLTKKIFGLNVNVYHYPEHHVRVVVIYCKYLAPLIESLFGKGALNKCFKYQKLFLIDPLLKLEALKCWMRGDGSKEIIPKRTRKLRGCTISRKLAYQMFEIATQNRIIASIQKSQHKNRKHPAYLITVSGIYFDKLMDQNKNKTKSRHWRHIFKNYILTPINNIKEIYYKGSVHNLEIEPSHSYFANGVKVCNCHHPYWPKEAIRTPNKENWEEILNKQNKESKQEIELLSNYCLMVSEVLDGYWSIDFAYGQDKKWYLIDCAEGDHSFHWLDCEFCPEEMRKQYQQIYEQYKDKRESTNIKRLIKKTVDCQDCGNFDLDDFWCSEEECNIENFIVQCNKFKPRKKEID